MHYIPVSNVEDRLLWFLIGANKSFTLWRRVTHRSVSSVQMTMFERRSHFCGALFNTSEIVLAFISQQQNLCHVWLSGACHVHAASYRCLLFAVFTKVPVNLQFFFAAFSEVVLNKEIFLVTSAIDLLYGNKASKSYLLENLVSKMLTPLTAANIGHSFQTFKGTNNQFLWYPFSLVQWKTYQAECLIMEW